jgi:tetratricopeptide (TPR) repeat protein
VSLRIVVALLAVALCLFAMQAAARFGFARLLSKYAVTARSIPAADQAIALAPSDAEAHRARARVLSRSQRPAEARKSFEIASSLRYRDDFLWIELGSTREEQGDPTAALAAFDQAVRWAPYYAHTLWQRGNLKLRLGQYDEAFADLRAAAASKTTLMPSLIDLAWGVTRGDAKVVEQLIQVKNDQDRLAFARFLAQKGKGSECVEQVRLLGASLSDQNRRELVQQLIAAKAFSAAFELWRTDESVNTPVILNGGFENAIDASGVDNGFGWYVFGKPEAKLVRDESEKRTGKTSLLLGFNGDWKAPANTIIQRIVVDPEKRYRISFGVKTKDLVSGAPPMIAVVDAASKQVLGQSEAFPTPSSNWQIMQFEFSTTLVTQAIVLEFTRVESANTPIFGELWLDDFVIEDVVTVNPQR